MSPWAAPAGSPGFAFAPLPAMSCDSARNTTAACTAVVDHRSRRTITIRVLEACHITRLIGRLNRRLERGVLGGRRIEAARIHELLHVNQPRDVREVLLLRRRRGRGGRGD